MLAATGWDRANEGGTNVGTPQYTLQGKTSELGLPPIVALRREGSLAAIHPAGPDLAGQRCR